MDNLTHTLMGACLAEGAFELSPASPHERARRRLFWGAAILGSNLPDADLLYAAWIMPPPLGYLLHHRGYTHTLIAVIPCALLVYAILRACSRTAVWDNFTRRDRRTALGLAIIGLLLHLLADSWNTYGIHPFFPFDNRWYYQDAVFVLEPLLWILMGSALLPSVQKKVRRRAGTVALLLFPLALTLSGFWHVSCWPAITAVAALLCWVQSRLQRRQRLILCAALVTSFVTGQFAAMSRASDLIRENLAANVHTSLKDIALTPIPMNPFCWSALTVESNGIVEVARLASVSLAPAWIAARDCPLVTNFNIGTHAQLVSTPNIAWLQEFRLPLSELRRMSAQDCRFAAWMKFARVPYAQNLEAVDLRYGYQGDRNFSALSLATGYDCPSFVPPWVPPREDLLQNLTNARSTKP